MILTPEQHTRAVNRLKKETPIEYDDGKFRSWDHEKVRKFFIFDTWDYLKLLYGDHLQEVQDGRTRLFDVPGDPNHYSMLNYLASNHSSFAIIVNYFNNKIIDAAKNGRLVSTRQISFDNYGINWESEMKEFLKLYAKYYEEVLKPQSNGVFDHIVKIIERTNKRGYLSEKEMLNFLKKVFPLAKNFETGGHGKSAAARQAVWFEHPPPDQSQ